MLNEDEKFHHFCQTIGLVNYFECSRMGIFPDTITGMFNDLRLAELLLFCKSKPMYHIVSYRNHLYVNFVLPEGALFFLADGSKDPNLSFFSKRHWLMNSTATKVSP